MNAEGALLELADAYDIEPGYHDILGHWHPLSRDTAVAILTAMGVDAGDDAAIERALDTARAARWKTTVPRVAVARGDAPFRLTLCLPASLAGATLHWRLRCECGHEHQGESATAALQLLESGDSGSGPHERRELELAPGCADGYHQLSLDVGDVSATVSLIRAPLRCQPPPVDATRGRVWGVTLQLYGLRSSRNWGIGDFGDLTVAIDALAAVGADLVGLNPLHALYPSTPAASSPYSPSSRRFLNPAYLDVEAIEDFRICDSVQREVTSAAFQERLQALRATELVDYEAVLPLKLEVLGQLYRHFRRHHRGSGSTREVALQAFRARGGEALARHTVFEALQAHHPGGEHSSPEALRDPDGATVREFIEHHEEAIGFFEYLQWQCSLQLEAAAARARERGMRVGLYLDLAVGSDGHGADAWREPDLHADGVSLGAPPDDFNLEGQAWGLPPWPPQALAARAFTPFADILASNMRHAGAIRIDHVLGLLRLFWVPSGAAATAGAYVRYPLDELLAITALESRRHGCVVVGEDLGTVPDAIRGALEANGVLSYRVLYFQKDWHGDHGFIAPEHYPASALATVSTHDLATFAGFWAGHDIDVRVALDLFPRAGMETAQRETREHDRWRLLDSLAHQGLRPDPVAEPGREPVNDALMLSVHRFLARTPCAIACVQMEDVLRQVEQANVPGTVDTHPNWRRKLELPVEHWPDHEPLRQLARGVSEERLREG